MCLAHTWWAFEENSSRRGGAQFLVLLPVQQHVHEVPHLLDGLVVAPHVLEAHVDARRDLEDALWPRLRLPGARLLQAELDVLLGDAIAPRAHGGHGRVVQHALQIRGRERGRLVGKGVEVRPIAFEGQGLRRAPQQLRARGQVGQPELDAPVEAPGAEQGVVEHLGPVRGREEEHAGGWLKTVHLGEEHVQVRVLIASHRATHLACVLKR
mmetsp:Transcript_160777/g.516032  ORF Transcript_160777/g.516032 Transcript_160777/m.516032 type:complete len:211 (+) Transcript_160777:1328-1960(+)